MPDIDQILIFAGDWLKITHPSIEEGGDGQVVYVRIKETNAGVSTNPDNTPASHYSDTISLDIFNNYSTKKVLNWHNCYSFGNGVESNRITDTFNSTQLTPGVKVSTIFEDYKEEHRKYGLIYSGLYNSTSGVNNLNQFIAAEKITKDINPTYGSIQKLHTRDTDLVTLCEDKVLKILASKDAVYNADGNPQLTSTNRVLGQAVPFVGEYGISKNPESFVSEAYRSYFTDKQRGSVMRLSKDGLTPISMHGMKDWFRDNLSTSKVNLLGEDILSSNDNWDHNSTTDNIYIENNTITFGYYNNDVHSSQAFRVANLRKNDVLEIGKKYRLQFDIVSHDGYLEESGGFGAIGINNTPVGGSWESEFSTGSEKAGNHVVYEWTANREDLVLYQSQLNNTAGSYDGGTVEEFVGNLRGEDGTIIAYTWWGGDWFYGGIATIANMVLEEVKVEPKIIGSYDDRQDEYNLTIHSATPKTISFREDTKGWVSFKSFFPENAISCANDYYTIKDGKLWQHHIQGSKRNTFYNTATNSSVNVILNDFPGSVKSFHTLDYEGSQSRVEGIKTIEVTGIEYLGGANDGRYFFFEESEASPWVNNLISVGGGVYPGNPEKALVMKQYRNNILIHSGLMQLWDKNFNTSNSSPSGGPTKGFGRRTMPDGNWGTASNLGDFEVGDIITTEEQEKTVNHFNSMPKDGWYVSDIGTDKQEGNLSEFIEKEGKWFNYIKGIDSDVSSTTDFGAFDIQGIGVIDSVSGNDITFSNNINSSLQTGDTLYSETLSEVEGDNIVDMNATGVSYATGFSVTSTDTAVWDGNSAFATGTWHCSNIQENEHVAGKTYRLKLEVLDYTGTGSVGVANDLNNQNNDPITNALASRTSVGVTTIDFISNGGKVDLFGEDTNTAIMKISVREVTTGNVFGFSRIESDQLQKCGIVTSLTNNTITVDDSGTLPSARDYIMFAKNHAVNTSGLLGYYADVKLENNSKYKAEIFSLSSEITESSK